jgi:hypothetical protein
MSKKNKVRRRLRVATPTEYLQTLLSVSLS